VHQEKFQTAFDNQTEVAIKIFFLKEHEGHKTDDKDIGKNESAWEEYKTFMITGLPPRPRGQSIDVELRYEEGGVIAGKAWDQFGNKVDIKGQIS